PVAILAQPARSIALPAPAPAISIWTSVAGRSPAAAHAVALAAGRAGETVAFLAHGQAQHEDLLLVLLAHLAADSSSAALWLVPDARSVQAAERLLGMLPSAGSISWQRVVNRHSRHDPSQVVVATFDELHRRLLAGADRGWRWLWPRLDLIVAPDLQRAPGAMGAHLAWLIRRVERLLARPLRLAAGVAPISEPEEALSRMLGRPVRVVVSDAAAGPVLVALWRSDDRLPSVRLLAAELLARGLPVTVLGRDEHETRELRDHCPSLPAEILDLPPDKARIAIVTGVPHDPDTRDSLVRRGYRLVIMVAGDEPLEALCAEQPGVLVARPPALPVAPGSAYAAGAHLQWAACEAPLVHAEIDRWDTHRVASLLLERGLLRVMADDQIQPGDAALDHGLDLIAATLDEPAFELRGPGDEVVARLLPHVADWWAMPGTTWQLGWVVGEHDAGATSAPLLPDAEPGIALPLLRFELTPRDEIGPFPARVGARTVAVTRAKVHIKQRVEGHTVYRPGEPPRPVLLARSLTRAWNAHACAIHLPVAPIELRAVGWALGLALPHVVRLAPGDALVTYDAASRAIWIVETHPGGAGLAACVADEIPRLMSTAVALAKAVLLSPVYGTLARAELAWLEPLHRPDDANQTTTLNPSPSSKLGEGSDTPAPFSSWRSEQIGESSDIPAPERQIAPSPVEQQVSKSTPSTREELAVGSDSTVEDTEAGGFFEEVVLDDLSTGPEPEAQASPNAGPDVAALISRMRRMRERREHEQTPAGRAAPADLPAPALRFCPGQRVRCVPYGEGIVREARVVGGREHLTINFADSGDLEVDPAVNVVRVLDPAVDRAEPSGPLIF
ncbi:MAG TPA: hypothetical protein VEZ12_03895, partial [Herpetosiphonaceae bacterium]|nr:hypothetical protein [Herpetosiphonaceae bacterium]